MSAGTFTNTTTRDTNMNTTTTEYPAAPRKADGMRTTEPKGCDINGWHRATQSRWLDCERCGWWGTDDNVFHNDTVGGCACAVCEDEMRAEAPNGAAEAAQRELDRRAHNRKVAKTGQGTRRGAETPELFAASKVDLLAIINA